MYKFKLMVMAVLILFLTSGYGFALGNVHGGNGYGGQGGQGGDAVAGAAALAISGSASKAKASVGDIDNSLHNVGNSKSTAIQGQVQGQQQKTNVKNKVDNTDVVTITDNSINEKDFINLQVLLLHNLLV